MSQILKNFIAFLKKNDVISLAIGVMVANSASQLTQSLVKDIMKPLADPLVSKVSKNTDLKTWKLKMGPFNVGVGSFFMSVVEFLIVGLVIVTIGTLANKYF